MKKLYMLLACLILSEFTLKCFAFTSSPIVSLVNESNEELFFSEMYISKSFEFSINPVASIPAHSQLDIEIKSTQYNKFDGGWFIVTIGDKSNRPQCRLTSRISSIYGYTQLSESVFDYTVEALGKVCGIGDPFPTKHHVSLTASDM